MSQFGHGQRVDDDRHIADLRPNVLNHLVAAELAMVGGAAQALGYVNIYLDAAAALCASFVIVDLGQRLGENIYASYLASFAKPSPSIPPIIYSMVFGGPVCYGVC